MVREDALDSPGIVVPPPAIYAVGLAAGFTAHHFDPIGLGARWPGFLLIASSLVLQVLAFREFRRHRTSVRPDRPSTQLITGGPFRYLRNPLYLSLSAIAVGVAFVVSGVWIAVGAIAAHVALRIWVVPREERYLESRFGDAYRTYKATVPRGF